MDLDKRSVGKYISILYRQSQCYIANEFSPYGIGKGQYIFLHVLYEHDGMSQEELASFLKMDKGTTARAVDKLEENGYVVRKKNLEDKRAYHLYVTPKAMEMKSLFYEKLREWTNVVLRGINEKEQALFFEVLEKMMQNAVCERHKKG